MSTVTIDSFTVDIASEHFEEVVFLCESGRAFNEEVEVCWLDPFDDEKRIEAHLDGLLVSQDLALPLCHQQAIEGGASELHAAVRVFCNQERLDYLDRVWELVTEHDESAIAACCALCQDLPSGWHPTIAAMLLAGNEANRLIAATVAGYHRLPYGDQLLSVLEDTSGDGLLATIEAIGRLRVQMGQSALQNIFRDREEDTVRASTSLALLRLGDRRVLSSSLDAVGDNIWASLPVGLSGSGEHAPALLSVAAKPGRPDILIALGILGESSAVESLLSSVENPNVAEASALALNLITGADLYEEVFVPEVIDPDELFDDELEKLRNGDPLYGPEEEQPGTTITKLTQDPDQWREWWQSNSSRFKSGLRYRNGTAFTPDCLVNNLRNEKSPRNVRQWAYDELVIRYNIDEPFETNMAVKDQIAAINRLAVQVQERSSEFEAGRWYFGGKPL